MRALLLALLFSAPFALAGHTETGRCDGLGLGIIQASDGTPEHTFYIDDRNYLLGNGIWLYEESNGIFTPFTPVTVTVAVDIHEPGPPHIPYWWVWVEETNPVDVTITQDDGDPRHNLQRGGGSVLNPYIPDEYDDDEICVDDPFVTPDTLIF